MNLLGSIQRTALPILAAGIGLGVYQGIKVRADFVRGDKLSVPSGPTFGRERIVWGCTDLLVETADTPRCKITNKHEKRAREELTKLSNFSDSPNDCAAAFGCCNIDRAAALPKPSRRRRLVVMGDSLVAGVGCDDLHDSPVLPKIIAAGLSAVFNCEVTWLSEGLVGATVRDIATRIWPSVQGTILSHNQQEPEEIVFVIICGLNDWKNFFLSFPNGIGPRSFKAELEQLVRSIQHTCEAQGQTCKVFLPTLPLVCLFSDPQFSLGLRPLRYLVQWICGLWDQQKLLVSRYQVRGYSVPNALSWCRTRALYE